MLRERRLTIRDINEQIPISFGSYQAILKDHLELVASQVVARTLNVIQTQQNRVTP